jgi:hypothetical protein
LKNKEAILPCSARLASAMTLGALAPSGCGGGGSSSAEVTAANVPPVVMAPTAANQIGFSGTFLTVPE